jgi:uncharacterized protein (TIGR02246 family)
MLKRTRFLAGGVVAALAIGVLSARDAQEPVPKPPAADLAAVVALSKEYVDAFNKGDAKAIAALWTEQGECTDAAGETIQGRAAIEKAFAAFFKDHPNVKVELLNRRVRFPAPDLAIEEGLLRRVGTGKDLPGTTQYGVTLARVGGKWRVAMSGEWGANQDRLEDLDWLLGQWKTVTPGQDVTLTYSRDEQKPYVVAQFVKRAGDKVVYSGTMRISTDPQTGMLRSWHFDEDGGHGQAVWVRDGSRWVQDSVGVLGDGTETASVNILGRVNNDEITWQSIDRVMGDQALPDTVPVKLTRVPAGK